MNSVLAFAVIIGLPLAASRGALYRGAWAGIAVISLVVGLGVGMTPAPPDSPGSTITTAEVKQWLFQRVDVHHFRFPVSCVPL